MVAMVMGPNTQVTELGLQLRSCTFKGLMFQTQAFLAVAIEVTSNIAFCMGPCYQLTEYLKIGDLASVRHICPPHCYLSLSLF